MPRKHGSSKKLHNFRPWSATEADATLLPTPLFQSFAN